MSRGKIFLLLVAITLLGAGLLVYFGETSSELWMSSATAQGEPTLEIRP